MITHILNAQHVLTVVLSIDTTPSGTF